MPPAKQKKSLLVRLYERDWSWVDSFIAGGLMLAVGYYWGRANHFHVSFKESVEFLTFMVRMFGAVAFWMLAWTAARAPRPPKDYIQWEKLSAAQMVVLKLSDNYIAITAALCTIGFMVSIAPGVSDIIASWVARGAK